MFRVLGELTRLNSIANLGQKIESGMKFNATLPVSIKVKEQTKPNHFMLDIGKKEQIETKSDLLLEVNKKYWGVLKQEPRSKAITISHLLKQPNILQSKLKNEILRFDENSLQEILRSKNPKELLKQNLLHQLSTATSKQEFLTLSNMLNVLQDNLFSFVFTHNQKETLFQFRKQKSKKKDKNLSNEEEEKGSIEFYAAFENLGPVEGVIELIDGMSRLTLYLFYENSLVFLKSQLQNLDLETNLYQKKGKIFPLHEFGNSLLDLKG